MNSCGWALPTPERINVYLIHRNLPQANIIVRKRAISLCVSIISLPPSNIVKKKRGMRLFFFVMLLFRVAVCYIQAFRSYGRYLRRRLFCR